MHLPGSSGREGIVFTVGFRLSGDILGFGVAASGLAMLSLHTFQSVCVVVKRAGAEVDNEGLLK